jgi:hypothetical protein
MFPFLSSPAPPLHSHLETKATAAATTRSLEPPPGPSSHRRPAAAYWSPMFKRFQFVFERDEKLNGLNVLNEW